MSVSHINKLLYYRCRIVPNGTTLVLPAEIAQQYLFLPDGVNHYIGINDLRIQKFSKSDSGLKTEALNSSDRSVIKELQEYAVAFGKTQVTLMLGLQPPKWFHPIEKDKVESGRKDPYGFVEKHRKGFVTSLALQLGEMLEENPRVRVVIRFASEMNDRRAVDKATANKGHNAWGQQAPKFKECFKRVREVFNTHAPTVKFAFSPTLRADLRPEANPNNKADFFITPYYPGNDFVDYVTCTWYGPQDPQDTHKSIAHFESYFDNFHLNNRPIAVDEMGVSKHLNGQKRNAVLKQMMDAMQLWTKEKQKEFEYVSLFMGTEPPAGEKDNPDYVPDYARHINYDALTGGTADNPLILAALKAANGAIV